MWALAIIFVVMYVTFLITHFWVTVILSLLGALVIGACLHGGNHGDGTTLHR